MVPDDPTASHRASQAALYGQPLAEIIAEIGRALGLNQARIAAVLGLSAPMLSHLVAGRRVKIGNPVAHARLGQLRALAADATAGRVGAGELADRLAGIEASSDSWATTELSTAASSDDPGALARQTQGMFRGVAAAGDFLSAADRLDAEFPAIAELLRIYGAGRSDSAAAHWARSTTG